MNKTMHATMIILPVAMLLVLCLMITTDVWWAYSLYIICAAALGACLAFAICGIHEENQKAAEEDEDDEDELIEIEEDEE